MRASYTALLHWCLDHRGPVLAGFAVFVVGSLPLALFIGRDFFPTVDSGQMRLHARAPAGTRLEETEVRLRRHRRRDPPGDSAARNRHHHRQHRHPQRRLQPGLRRQPHHRQRRRRHPDFAQSRRTRLHRRIHRPAAQAPAREVPGRDVLLRSRQHHQPDPEFRPARAHRRAGGGPQRRRQLPHRPATRARRSPAFPAPPTCIFTRWWTSPRSTSTWTATRPARWG